jgi:hypothetical protein
LLRKISYAKNREGLKGKGLLEVFKRPEFEEMAFRGKRPIRKDSPDGPFNWDERRSAFASLLN